MSLEELHRYRLDLDWTGNRAGMLSGGDVPPLPVAPPLEFSGPGGVWTPEHLLVASSASCLMATFLAIAEASKLAITSFHMEADGRLEKVPGKGYRFAEITLAPKIGVASEDIERAKRLLEKAEKGCLINRSLSASVRVDPSFVPEPAGVAR